MRRFLAVISSLMISGSVAVADEESDIALVEEELRAMEQAAAIEKKAANRALQAVEASSHGQRCGKLQARAEAAQEAFMSSPAYKEYKGEDRMTKRELIRDHALTSGEEEARRERQFVESWEPIELLLNQAVSCLEKSKKLVERVVRIFLDDEIEKATRKKQRSLVRELKKIKSDYANI